MRVIASILFLLPVLVLAALACGGEEADPATVAAPTQVAVVQATAKPETATEESPQERQEPTEPIPTVQPTAVATPTEPAPTPEATSVPQPTDTPQPTPNPEEASEDPSADSGAGPNSFIVGEGSEIKFIVKEETSFAPVRFDAEVSGTGLSGFANLDGSPSVILLDLHALESDQSFRDGYIRSRMFPNTPTATVVVESLPDLPQSFFDGEKTTGTLAGSLQIGETVTTLTFDVEARHDGNVINVLGRTTFTWDDLGLGKPVFGPVTYLGDEVQVQVLIVARER